ncbi:MAG: hypothetical protein M5T61_17365 [Acidimicrobiia bacterium]|nr:hypothetical protein [Acidimicrobiia bacterium]
MDVDQVETAGVGDYGRCAAGSRGHRCHLARDGADLVVPPQLWLTLPFVVTLVALSGLAGSQAAPAAIAVQYRRRRDV